VLERAGPGPPYLSFVQLIESMDSVTRDTVMCEVGRNEDRVWHWLILRVTPKHSAQEMKELHDMKILRHSMLRVPASSVPSVRKCSSLDYQCVKWITVFLLSNRRFVMNLTIIFYGLFTAKLVESIK
jgi:hypothetical protein